MAIEDFRNRIYGAKQSLDNSNLANVGMGNTVKLTRDFEALQNLFENMSKDTLPTLLKLLGMLSKDQIKNLEFVEKYLKLHKDKLKLDEKIIDNAIKLSKAEKEQFEIKQKLMKQEHAELSENQRLLQLKKQIFQSEAQIQKNAIDSWEKNFWGPFKNMFRASHLQTYSKELSSATAKGYEGIFKSLIGNAQAINRTILARTGDQIGAVVTNAAQSLASEIYSELRTLPGQLKESFKKGKQEYFERLREKVAIKEEKNVDKLDDTIRNFGEVINIMESKWEMMINHGYRTFKEFEKSQNIGKSGVSGISGVEKESGKSANKSESFGPNWFQSMKAKAGGFLSGAVSSIGTGVDIGMKVLSSALDKAQEIASVITDILMEERVAMDEIRKGFALEFGQEKFTSYILTLRDLSKGIDWENIKEGYSGLLKIYGTTRDFTEDLIKYQIQFNKLYQISGDEGALFFKVMQETGFKGVKNIEMFRKQVDTFSRKEGVSSREVMRDITKNVNYIALVGNPKMVKGFMESASQLRTMGLHIDMMVKSMDNFESFESAAENTFKLNAALGTQLDPMRMHVMSMMGDVQGIQDYLFKNLTLEKDLNVLQMKALSQALGITFEEGRAMEHGLKIRKEMSGYDEKSVDYLFQQKDVMSKLNDLGFENKKQKEEFLQNKLGKIFEDYKNKGVFKTFKEFQDALMDPNSKKGKDIREQLRVSVISEERQMTMEEALTHTAKLQDEIKQQNIDMAHKNENGIKGLNTIMTKMNEIMAQILAWFVNIGTKMAAGILDFAGFHNTGTFVESVGEQMSNAIKESQLISEKSMEKFGMLASPNTMFSTKSGKATSYKDVEKEWVDPLQTIEKEHPVVAGVHSMFSNKDVNSELIQKMRQNISGDENFWKDKNKRQEYYKNEYFKTKSDENMSDANKDIYLNHLYEALNLNSKFATGGYISGQGGPKDDKIPAMLSNGEYVINASSVKMMGKDFFDQINGMGIKGYKDGDFAGVFKNPMHKEFQLQKSSSDTMESRINKKVEEIKNRKSILPTIPQTNKEINNQAYSEVMDDFYSEQENKKLNHPINKALNSLKAVASMVTKIPFGIGKGAISPLKILESGIGQSNVIGQLEDELNPDKLFGVNKKMLKRSGDSNIEEFGNVIQTISEIYGASKAFQSAEHHAPFIKDIQDKSLKMLTTGIGIHVPEMLHGISHGNNISGSIGKEIVNALVDSKLHLPLAAGASLTQESSEIGRNEITGKFANGTMKGSSIPGFVSTNDYDRFQFHKDETLQVMNNDQKISRDDLLEKVISMLLNGYTNVTDLKINEEAFGRIVTKVLFREVNS
jgi:hypothetical protein